MDTPLSEKRDWPKTLNERSRAIRETLAQAGKLLQTEAISQRFRYARRDRIDEILHLLADIGQVHEVEDGRFVG